MMEKWLLDLIEASARTNLANKVKMDNLDPTHVLTMVADIRELQTQLASETERADQAEEAYQSLQLSLVGDE